MFCDAIWARSAPLLDAIHSHPFVTELAEGVLDPKRFGFYILQDARYLTAYSKVLATASVRAEDTEEAAFWAESARTALVAEKELHESYVRELDLTDEGASPTSLAYSSYLQAVAMSAPYQVTVAAVLPCFWIYQDVGEALREHATPGNPYAAWISTYADPAFAEAVTRAKAIADRQADPAHRAAMEEAFLQAARYEWMFWDSAYRLEQWPTVM